MWLSHAEQHFHSVVCDSMDHWFAPVKQRSELGFSCLLHCSTSHAIITVRQSLTMLNVYLVRTGARQTWCCCRRGMQAPPLSQLHSHPKKHLILRGGLISFIIRCPGCCDTQRPLMPSRWHAVSWVASVKDTCGPAEVSTPCKDKRPGEGSSR